MKIDATRIVEIFRVLSQKPTVNTARGRPGVARSTDATVVQAVGRDINMLRSRLASRISRAEDRSAASLSLIAIQEIIHWEFGDEILEHPEYKFISKSIADGILRSPALAEQAKSILESLPSS